VGAAIFVVLVLAFWFPVRQLRRALEVDAPNRKRVVLIWSGSVVLMVGCVVHYFFAPLGALSVRVACESDGGTQIFRTVKVDGYWHGEAEWAVGAPESDCGLCVEQVASGDFAYVYFELPKQPIMGRSVSQLVRYQLAVVGDANCLADRSQRGIKGGQCVAIVPLETPPSDGYRYRSTLQQYRGLLGISLLEQARSIIDVNSREVIATHRYFSYATPFEAQGKLVASYHCLDPAERRFVDNPEKRFIDSVLRQTSKTRPSNLEPVP
jgi:hypothetical protein